MNRAWVGPHGADRPALGTGLVWVDTGRAVDSPNDAIGVPEYGFPVPTGTRWSRRYWYATEVTFIAGIADDAVGRHAFGLVAYGPCGPRKRHGFTGRELRRRRRRWARDKRAYRKWERSTDPATRYKYFAPRALQ